MTIWDLVIKYLKHESINAQYDEDLLKASIEQAIQTILYETTNVKEYKKYYVSWINIQNSFYKAQNDLTNKFNELEIEHMYFKGSVLSKIYDDPYVRTRGDIDVYIEPAKIDLAKNACISLGFELKNDDCMHHISLIRDKTCVELHFNMLDDDLNKSWIKMFNSPFELCDEKNGYNYKMNDTYHFIYCMMHFAHHLRYGAGLRYLMDFYYMLSKTKIDFEFLHNILNELNLNILYANIINSLRVIKDFDNKVEDKNIDFFIEYLTSYGIHGNSNNKTSSNSAIHHNKLKYAFNRIFLINKKYRLSKYPKMSKYKILYPICVIRHIFYLITHKFKAFIKFLFGKNNNKKLYKKLGI